MLFFRHCLAIRLIESAALWVMSSLSKELLQKYIAFRSLWIGCDAIGLNVCSNYSRICILTQTTQNSYPIKYLNVLLPSKKVYNKCEQKINHEIRCNRLIERRVLFNDNNHGLCAKSCSGTVSEHLFDGSKFCGINWLKKLIQNLFN